MSKKQCVISNESLIGRLKKKKEKINEWMKRKENKKILTVNELIFLSNDADYS